MADIRFLVAEEIANVYSKETTIELVSRVLNGHFLNLMTLQDNSVINLFGEYDIGKGLIEKHQVDQIVVELGPPDEEKYLILYSAGTAKS